MHSIDSSDYNLLSLEEIGYSRICDEPPFIVENNDFENYSNSSNDFLPKINTFLKTSEEKVPILLGLNYKLENKINFGQQKTINEDIINEKEVAKGFTLEEIKGILKNSNISSSNVEEIFVPDSNLTKIEKEIIGFSLIKRKKRRRKGKIKFSESKQKIRGRKSQEDLSHRKHNKYSADNIIKKVKSKFLDNALLFINNVIRTNLNINELTEYNKLLRENKRGDCQIENLIKPIDYRLIDKIKREKDLLLLKQPLKDIFSNDISSKYTSLPKNSNRKIIERIIEDHSSNASIRFAFNLTFEDWIDVFLCKIKLNSIINYDKEKMKDMENNFIKIDKLILQLNKVGDNNNYLSYFLFYAFNYKRWFLLKNGRKRVSKEISKK